MTDIHETERAVLALRPASTEPPERITALMVGLLVLGCLGSVPCDLLVAESGRRAAAIPAKSIRGEPDTVQKLAAHCGEARRPSNVACRRRGGGQMTLDRRRGSAGFALGRVRQMARIMPGPDFGCGYGGRG